MKEESLLWRHRSLNLGKPARLYAAKFTMMIVFSFYKNI